jgi:hypothetical protein
VEVHGVFCNTLIFASKEIKETPETDKPVPGMRIKPRAYRLPNRRLHAITVFQVMINLRLVSGYQCFGGISEDGCSMFLRNAGIYLPDDVVSFIILYPCDNLCLTVL